MEKIGILYNIDRQRNTYSLLTKNEKIVFKGIPESLDAKYIGCVCCCKIKEYPDKELKKL